MDERVIIRRVWQYRLDDIANAAGISIRKVRRDRKLKLLQPESFSNTVGYIRRKLEPGDGR